MSLTTGTAASAGQSLAQSSLVDDVVDTATGPTTATQGEPETDPKNAKAKKRSLFGFSKEDQSVSDHQASRSSTSGLDPTLQDQSFNKIASTVPSASSPALADHTFPPPSSPGRGFSGSPRMSSPGGSQIFERDVDSMTALQPQSTAVPSHIQTENHIPPVLDASSEAITNDHLDPDSVEIITHAQHQPASVAVTGGSLSQPNQPSFEQLAASWAEDLGPLADRTQDGASSCNALDSADVRRLSFISFADVVQAEHAGVAAGSRDSVHVAGLTSLSANRSPSPVLSPVSSQGASGTSPPTSNPASVKGLELSPSRKPLTSPISASHHTLSSGEVNVETMTQALRRTASRDLSGVRSIPVSPIEGPSR